MAGSYAVNPGWVLVLRDFGVAPDNVMRRAGLPDDLLTRPGATISADEYARVFRGLEAEVDRADMPILLAEAVSFESFDPPIFAAMCSPDLVTALARMARFKPLCAPMTLRIEERDDRLCLEIAWVEPTVDPPASLLAIELTFFARLARLATRTRVCPVRVTATVPLAPARAYAAFFGTEVEVGATNSLWFRLEDARRPFLTAKAGMWQFFEPELRKRLALLDASASMAERTRSALLELLPSGRSTIGDVALRLGVGARTLQRRLREDGDSYQAILNRTREELAIHYLRSTEMSGAEISFLLGFEDPNSFVRAFHAWTGRTPERTRAVLRAVD